MDYCLKQTPDVLLFCKQTPDGPANHPRKARASICTQNVNFRGNMGLEGGVLSGAGEGWTKGSWSCDPKFESLLKSKRIM